jgi:3-oxoadipate enol-lactonase/4-carboxymuconolactone decarboxylase
MPFATRDGVRLHWREDGDPANPPLLLLNSIGTDLSLWDAVVPHLIPAFRVVRMDARGHGASDTPPGDYALADLGRDALAVLGAAGVERAAVCGVSLGGMVGQWLGLEAPDRLDALVLACTTDRVDPEAWRQRAAVVREKGVGAIADMVMERFFAPAFRAAGGPLLASVRASLHRLDRQGYAGCCAAIRDMELGDRIAGIGVRTLVVGGRDDVAMPPAEHAARMARLIPGAELAVLPTGHLPPYEDPRGTASLIRRFLQRDAALDAARDALFDAGLANRRAVLGDDWVDRSLAKRTAFTGEFQAMITRVAWEGIWGRPGLDHRTRRLLVVATTVALGRWEEYRLHVRAGLSRGGFTVDELKETLMQSAVYAGVPAANTAFAEAAEAMAELGIDPGPWEG